jgi:hypothetical protein
MESPSLFRLETALRPLQSRRALALFAVVGLLTYVAIFVPLMGVHAGSSDCSGYMNQARLMAEGRTSTPQRIVDGVPPQRDTPYLYVPLGFRPLEKEPLMMVPTYPTGLSLLLLGGAKVSGWVTGPTLVMVLHMLGGVLATFVLARIVGLGPWWSGLAATIVGLSPLYVFMSLQAMSDVPTLMWVTAAIVLAEIARDRGAAWAAGAGGAFALAVLLRPTNLLALLPVALALGLSWQRWLAFGLGGLPGAVFLGCYNLAAYGAILTTGYGVVTGSFKSRLFVPTVLHYVYWLPLLVTPVVVLFLGLPALARRHARRAAVLMSWVVLFLGFYSVYDHTHETWWFLRFVLPAFPALVVGGLWVAHQLLAHWRMSAVVASAVWVATFAAVVVFSTHWIYKVAAHWAGRHEEVYPTLCEWAKAHLPGDAVIVAMQVSGALLYYTDFTFVRWDHAQTSDIARIEAACAQQRRPLYALLFPYEEPTAFSRWQPGSWVQVGQIEQVSVWQRLTKPGTELSD